MRGLESASSPLLSLFYQISLTSWFRENKKKIMAMDGENKVSAAVAKPITMTKEIAGKVLNE